VMLLLFTTAVLLWWLTAVILYNNIVVFGAHRSILEMEYWLTELVADVVVLAFSGYIWMRYIHRMIGDSTSSDCTNLDLYAVLSLLWTLMLSMLYLINREYELCAVQMVRILALTVPGYIHKTYVRYKVHSALGGHHYLGDIQVYKSVMILFYAVQLLSNVIRIPLNDDWFADTIHSLFDLDDLSDYNLPFIVSSVVGRPFLSMLLFHSLMLYITWFTKPRSYHDIDLFALSFGNDSELNIKTATIVVVLFITDLLFQKYYIYATLYLLFYGVVSVVLISYTLYHCCCVRAPSRPQPGHRTVDILEILESAFVLGGSLTAIGLYASSKVKVGKLEEEFGAFCELAALSMFMVAQYATICFIQFHMDRMPRPPAVVVISGAMSAVSIMYLFLFEYHHLISLLDAEHEFTDELKVAYSLFWCPIEYFVWSFVTVNHMLHHWRSMEFASRLKHSASMPTINTALNGKVSSVAEVIDANASRRGSLDLMPMNGAHGLSRRRNSSLLFVQNKEESMQLNPMAFSPTISAVKGGGALDHPESSMEEVSVDKMA